MNWGYGIMTVIICFVLSILGMVVVSSRQTIDMMDDKYYERELAHQSLIDESDRFVEMNGAIRFEDHGDVLTLSMPVNTSDHVTSGLIEFMRPSDKKLDRSFVLAPSDGKQRFDKSDFTKGLYHIRLSWINNGQSYYQSFNYVVE